MVYSRRCIFQIFWYGIILTQVVSLEVLFDRDILYPLSLLWVHTSTALITYLITNVTIKSVQGSAFVSCCSRPSSLETPTARWERALRFASGFLDVLTYFCVVQALFHTRSITLPMLFYYIADAVAHLIQLFYLRFRPGSLKGFVAVVGTPILFVLPFVALIILSERKFNPLALAFLLPGAGSYIAKVSIDCYQAHHNVQRPASQWPPWVMLSALLVTTSGSIAFGLEGLIMVSRGGMDKLKADLYPPYLLPSILLGVLSAVDYSNSGCNDCGDNSYDVKWADSQTDYATLRAAMDSVAMFVCTFLLFLQTPTWVQLISYGVLAFMSTFGVFAFGKGINHRIEIPAIEVDDPDMELEDYTAAHKLLNSDEIGIRRRNLRLRGAFYSFTVKLWILFAALLGTKLLLERPSYDTKIDRISSNDMSKDSFDTSRGFEIVVSYYQEDLEGVKSFVDKVKSIPKIRALNPTVTIYNKNNKTSSDFIKHSTGADKVTLLPNQGREAGAYFHHIINRWDTLANHTLFIQAQPHALDRVVNRLKLNFDPMRTGMMDVGYRELRGCKCLDCRDEYSWRDVTGFIPEMMSQSHHIKCDENTQVLTSYKGQFVVSSKRIRAARKSFYEGVNNKLVGPDRMRLGWDADTEDAPDFGYAVERSWNIIFQCADLTGRRDMCPGLTLVGTAFGDLEPARPEDCGCLDE